MALKLNNKGFNHAKSLIKQGKIDYDSSWSMSADGQLSRELCLEF